MALMGFAVYFLWLGAGNFDRVSLAIQSLLVQAAASLESTHITWGSYGSSKGPFKAGLRPNTCS